MSQMPIDPGHEMIEALERLREMNWELMGRLNDGIEQVSRVREALLSSNTDGDLTEVTEGLESLIQKNEEHMKQLHDMRETLDRIVNQIPRIRLRTQLFQDLMQINEGLMEVNEELVTRLQEESSRILEELERNQES